MVVLLILCAVALSLFMTVTTIYVDGQVDINQAKENAQPHTYHVASVVKSTNETFINTAEGVQFVIDPSDSEWLEYKDGDTISVTYGQSKSDQKGRVLYAYTITTKQNRMDTLKRHPKRNKLIGTPIKSQLIRKEIQ